MNAPTLDLPYTDPFPTLFSSPAPLPMGGGGLATSPPTCADDGKTSPAHASASARPECAHASAHVPALTREEPELFRWRVIGRCPCCLSAWVMDIDAAEDPIAEWANRKMTDALLCGSCKARRFVLYRSPDGKVHQLWTSRDVAAMLAHVQDPSMDLRPFVRKKRPLVEVGPERPPIDQIEDTFGRFRGLSVVGDGVIRAAGVDWTPHIRYALAIAGKA